MVRVLAGKNTPWHLIQLSCLCFGPVKEWRAIPESLSGVTRMAEVIFVHPLTTLLCTGETINSVCWKRDSLLSADLAKLHSELNVGSLSLEEKVSKGRELEGHTAQVKELLERPWGPVFQL